MEPSLSTDERLHASKALMRFWRYLLGAAVFPTAVVLTDRFAHPPDALFFLLFAIGSVVSMVPPMWLVMSGRVKGTFWFVTIAVLFAGAVVAQMIANLIKFGGT